MKQLVYSHTLTVILLTTLGDFFAELFYNVLNFFLNYGEYGLFLYSILETITPLAGVEFFLIPLVLDKPERWLWITFIVALANTIGAFIVYFFMAKEDGRFFNRFVRKHQQIKARKLFNRYGFWAIFIFAMTPLPFFVIVFTAAIAKMKFYKFIVAAFFSRFVRFGITNYIIYSAKKSGEAVSTGSIVIWLATIGVGFTVSVILLQKLLLYIVEKKLDKNSEEENESV